METVLFVIARLLTSLASPLSLFLIIMLIMACRVLRSMERPRLRRGFFILWFVAVIFSLPLVSHGVLALWESPLGSPSATKADAIVVLGGAVDAAATTGWQIAINDSAERIVSAARLWHEGKAPLIIVSGGSGDLHFPEAREAPLLKRLLEGMGVPGAAIILESDSRNTFENATKVRALVDAYRLKRIIMVTSALHMPRAKAIFEKTGFSTTGGSALNMECLAVDSLRSALVFPESFIPNASAVLLNSRVIKEITGFLAYRLLGRL